MILNTVLCLAFTALDASIFSPSFDFSEVSLVGSEGDCDETCARVSAREKGWVILDAIDLLIAAIRTSNRYLDPHDATVVPALSGISCVARMWLPG